jgi:hypothetical protein
MIRKIEPSTSMWVPVLNWLVEITAPEGSGRCEDAGRLTHGRSQ